MKPRTQQHVDLPVVSGYGLMLLMYNSMQIAWTKFTYTFIPDGLKDIHNKSVLHLPVSQDNVALVFFSWKLTIMTIEGTVM